MQCRTPAEQPDQQPIPLAKGKKPGKSQRRASCLPLVDLTPNVHERERTLTTPLTGVGLSGQRAGSLSSPPSEIGGGSAGYVPVLKQQHHRFG